MTTLPRNWAAIRKAALRRAGYRSERSGLVGRLEVHHRRGRAAGHGRDNLEVLTRTEHIELHRHDRRRAIGPLAHAWRALLDELLPGESSD